MSSKTPNYPPSVTALFGQIVGNVRTAVLEVLQEADPRIQTITYIYGNIKEVAQRVQELFMTMTDGAKTIPFPAIIVLEDIPIDRTNTRYFGIATLTVWIVYDTKLNYSSAERETKTFIPILRPLYYQFLHSLAKSKYTVVANDKQLGHTMIERKQWGADENTKTVFTTVVDGIELVNIRVPIDWDWYTHPINDII